MTGFDLKRAFEVDSRKEIDGVWQELGNGAAILVARLGNPNFRKAYNRIPNATRKMIENETLENDVGNKIYAGVIADTVLLDWKNILLDGKQFKYTRENAIKVLLDYPQFQNLVLELSQSLELFRTEELEEKAKN